MNLCIDKDGVGKQDNQVTDIDNSYHVKSALWAAKWPLIDWSHVVCLVVCCCVCWAVVQRWMSRTMFIIFNLSLKTHLILICQPYNLFHLKTEHLYRCGVMQRQHLVTLARMKRSPPQQMLPCPDTRPLKMQQLLGASALQVQNNTDWWYFKVLWFLCINIFNVS